MKGASCPYCEKEIGYAVHMTWAGNFSNWLEMKCPKCGEMIEIEVEYSEPEFLLYKREKARKPAHN